MPESPQPMRTRSAPASSAARISAPTPALVVSVGSRLSRGTSLSPAVAATSITALKGLKLGVQVGTTSLDYVNAVVQPTEQVQVFNDTDGAKQALKNGTIDALVVDLPTAFYITAAEINNSVITGQFREADVAGDEWGLVLQKGSPLLGCVNQALGSLTESGALAELQETWLSSTAEVPFFTE